MRFFRNLQRYVVRITSFGFGFSLALGNFFCLFATCGVLRCVWMYLFRYWLESFRYRIDCHLSLLLFSRCKFGIPFAYFLNPSQNWQFALAMIYRLKEEK